MNLRWIFGEYVREYHWFFHSRTWCPGYRPVDIPIVEYIPLCNLIAVVAAFGRVTRGSHQRAL